MHVKKLSDDVYEISDFLNETEISDVRKIVQNTPEEKWFDEDMISANGVPEFWQGKNLYFDEGTVFDSINAKMRNLLASYSYYPKSMHLQRYKKGDFIKRHADQWIPDLPYYIGYGFCIYFNDEYLGGELEYHDLGIVVKPRAGSLYVHGGHVVHGSLPVLDDKIRYFSTIFVHGTEKEPTRLREDLFA